MKFFILLFLLCLPAGIQAQFLVKDHVWLSDEYYGEEFYDMEFSQIARIRFGVEMDWTHDVAVGEYNFKQLGLPKPKQWDDAAARACGEYANGYYAIFELMRGDHYECTLVLYNMQKMIIRQYSLTELISHDSFRDVHVDGSLFYVTMGTEVACLNIQTGANLWQTAKECVSCFGILTPKFFIGGYGGTGKTDYVRLLDRNTGRVLTSALVDTEPQVLGTTAQCDTVYTLDYSGKLYRFAISNHGVVVKGNTVRLRQGPGTTYGVYTDSAGNPVYVSKGDVLQYVETKDDWFCVRFNDQLLYVSAQFAEVK